MSSANNQYDKTKEGYEEIPTLVWLREQTYNRLQRTKPRRMTYDEFITALLDESDLEDRLRNRERGPGKRE